MPLANSFIPPALDFQPSKLGLESKQNFVRFGVVSGEKFKKNESFRINIQSSTDFIDVRKSYLRYDLRFTGASGAGKSGNTITSLGGASVLKSVKTTLGGLEVENITEYNNYISQLYSRSTETYKKALAQLEGYGTTNAWHQSDDIHTQGRTVVHALRTGLFEQSDNYIATPFIRNGITLEITLADFAEVYKSAVATADTDFEVSNTFFVACMVDPGANYLQSFSASLSKGSVAETPITLTRHVRYSPTDATSQIQNHHISYLKSLRSVMAVSRLNTSFASTVDTFALNTNNKLKSFRFQVGSEFYPKNFAIGTNSESTLAGGVINPEVAMMQMVSADNNASYINLPVHTADTGNIVFYSFGNEYGNGIPLSDGIVSNHFEYSSSPSSASVVDLYFTYDSVLKISATDIWVDSRELK